MKSWIPVQPNSDFGLINVPFGVFSVPGRAPVGGTIVGDTVVHLGLLQEAGLMTDILSSALFDGPDLNAFAKQPQEIRRAVRARLQQLFSDPPHEHDNRLYSNYALRNAALIPIEHVTMHLPVTVGDYTDFYSSREHATNVGTMFRGADNALQPNWLQLPVGYHGRSSTVFVSPHTVRRPKGQLPPKDGEDTSTYGPSKLLDFELEVATVVGGPPNEGGRPLTLAECKKRIFGFLLMNDWSARDIQKWEYVPLGPFTSKNFATTISPWIVTAEALEAFAAATSTGTEQTQPVPLDYLVDPHYGSYDVSLTVGLQSARMHEANLPPHTVSKSNFRNMYWNAAQQLVHHSVTGCIMRAGDLLGSGTISGSRPDSYGSMLELSWRGSKPVPLGDNETRKFLQDGDTVTMKGSCLSSDGDRLGFGECRATILPSVSIDMIGSATLTATSTNSLRYHDLQLYGFWRSSATWRVRIALAAKGIPFHTIPVDLTRGENKQEHFLKINPLGQVPYLVCTDTESGELIGMSQSVAVLNFLEQAFPETRRLVPSDPVDQATAWEMVQIVNAEIQPLQNVFYLHRFEEMTEGTIKSAVEAKKVIAEGLRVLEHLVARQRRPGAGPFATGSFGPTVADCCIVPQMYNARRFGVDVDLICPTLVTIDAECQSLPFFAEAHPSKQPDCPDPDV